MRAVVPSRKVVVLEGENNGLTSSVDSARFQSDELEVSDLPALFFRSIILARLPYHFALLINLKRVCTANAASACISDCRLFSDTRSTPDQ
jgi:hypothetical protein